MANTDTFTPYALLIGATSVPFDPSSLRVDNENTIQEMRTGGRLSTAFYAVAKKRPMIAFSTPDPGASALDFTVFSTGVSAHYRCYATSANFGTTYASYTLGQGIIYPVSLSGSAESPASLSLIAIGAYATGSAVVVGTTSASPAVMSKAYYPKTITVGSSTITLIENLSCNWAYTIDDDHVLEPEYYYYTGKDVNGSVTTRDVSEVTLARLEDGAVESVALTFEDRSGEGSDVTVTVGTCRVEATISGENAEISFKLVDNS